MFALGIPRTQYRRADDVLNHSLSDPILFDAEEQEDGFFLFSFPEMDEDGFSEVVIVLNNNGVTTIGADEQLTENKIMKLTEIYRSLNDRPLDEDMDKGGGSNEEIVFINIPGVDGKTKVKINHPREGDDKALKGVTITFMYGAEDAPSEEFDEVEKYTDLDFEAELDYGGTDHGNEGKDLIFVAEADDGTIFEVEVSVEASYEHSGNIQEIKWEYLEVIFDDKGESLDEQGCTEQEIAEGTCGYGVDGKPGKKPSGPHLNKKSNFLQERFKKLANIK